MITRELSDTIIETNEQEFTGEHEISEDMNEWQYWLDYYNRY